MFETVEIRYALKVHICSETRWESLFIIANDFVVRARLLSLGGHTGISHDIVVRQSVLNGLDSCLEGLLSHGWLSRQNPEVVEGCVAPEPVTTRVDNRVVIVVSLHHGVIGLIHGCSLSAIELDRERGVTSFGLHSSAKKVDPARPAEVVPVVDNDGVVFLQGVLSLDTVGDQFERDVLVDKDFIPDTTVSLDIKGSLGLVVGIATTEMEGSGGC